MIGGGKARFQTTSPFLRSHCAYGTRSLLDSCLFFALSQRIGEEKTLKGLMPLRNPQDFVLSLSFGGYQKAFCLAKPLRRQIQRFASCCKQAIIFCTPFAALQRVRREITCELFMLCLNFSQHERQVENERAFAFRFAENLSCHKPRGTASRALAVSCCVPLPCLQVF